jgi:hypothetical protein
MRTHGVIVPLVKNGEGGLIEGQRRIAAIRKEGMGIPVKYIIHEGGIDTVSTVNESHLNWGYKEWLHRYASTDHEDYKTYQFIAEKYEKYMRSRSLRGMLMLGRADALPLDTWNSGNFRINKEMLPINLKYLEFLPKVFDIGGRANVFAKDRSFQKALHEIFKTTKNLDEERLLYKMRYFFNDLNVKSDYKNYKKMIGEFYNKRLPGDKHHVVTEDTTPEQTPAEPQE